MRIEVVFQQPEPAELPPMFAPAPRSRDRRERDGDAAASLARRRSASAPPRRRWPTVPAQRDPTDPSTWGRVGRNEPCPCGSGKKYKHCHGQFVA